MSIRLQFRRWGSTGQFLWRVVCAGMVMVAMLAVSGPVRQAFAHASLLSALPADGVTIPDAPKTFELDFNEPVSPLVMRLVRPGGEITTLSSMVAANTSVTITAPAMAEQGTYALSWRVISADGHPVGGVVSFALGHPSAGVHVPPVVGATTLHIAIWAMQLMLAIGLFVGAGGAAFAVWLAGARPLPGEKLIVAAMICGIVAAVISIPLQGLDALAQPLSGLWRPTVWAEGFRTSWGSTVVLAVATLAVGLVALHVGNRFWARVLTTAAIAGIGFALVASGHASTSNPKLLTMPALFIHAVCIAVWVGSLLPLAMTVRAGDHAALQRFSGLIPVPLLLLIATGVVLATVELDRLDALWTTNYGLVLSGKLILVFLLLALAALNRLALVPRLSKARPGRLVQVIAAEFAITLVILGVVGLWRFTPPPRALAAAETTYIHFHGERAMAQIDVTPQRGRGAAVSIAVTDPDFNPVAAKEVALVIWNPGAGIEPVRRTATFLGGAKWSIGGLRIPIAGIWRMRVEILISDFEKVMIEDNVELPRAP